MEGQHSMWPKGKDGLRCPPRGHSPQGLEEVKGESRRWSAGTHSDTVHKPGQGAQGGGSQLLIHAFPDHPG